MTNHVHLLITPQSTEAVSRFVTALGPCYVQYINKTCGRTGTLWHSRYKSSRIDGDTYLLSRERYIEMNPVRAGIVDDPAYHRAPFQTHIDDDPINDIRLALQQGQPLGDSRFTATIARMTGQRREAGARASA